MKAAILCVGTELLFGQITNTNATYLSKELNNLGIDALYHYTVGDNAGRLEKIINYAFEDCDLILTTGGLGPTQDDLTKEIVSRVFGYEMLLNEEELKVLKRRFEARGSKMTENNIKQVYFPLEAKILQNKLGTAPGMFLEKDGKMIFCMPGPPREMMTMFEAEVRPILLTKTNDVIFYKILRTFGIGESSLETILLDLIDKQTDPTIATYAKEGECSIRIASKRQTIDEAKAAVDSMIEEIKKRLGDAIYSFDNEDLSELVAKRLIEKNITIAAAESCTGGLFSKMLTDYPGISAVFDRDIVTYSEKAKVDELLVSEEILDKYTAVSPETAISMAKNLYNKTGCRLTVSVTGYAGPFDEETGKIFLGFCFDGKEDCVELNLNSNRREYNRRYAALNMFYKINSLICN